MNARRIIIDGLIVCAGLLLVSTPAWIDLVSALKPFRYTVRSRALALPPHFAYETNKQGVCPIVILTVINQGATQLSCQLEFTDCQAIKDQAQPLPFVFPATLQITIPQAQKGDFKLVGLPGATWNTNQVLLYEVHWNESAPWASRVVSVHPLIATVLEYVPFWPVHKWTRPLEEGYVFGSNVGVDDYFRLIYGLNRSRWGAEESAEAAKVVDAFKRRLATNILGGASRGLNSARDVEFAKAVLQRDPPALPQTLTPKPVREAYRHWMNSKIINRASKQGSSSSPTP